MPTRARQENRMNWSYSAGRTFAGCPRRWFYRAVVAHHAAKDPVRRTAYLLGKQDSVWSWRGRLVDETLSTRAVPLLGMGRPPEPSELVAAARARFGAQLEFARTHRLNDPGLKPPRHPDFLALSEFEAGTPPTEAALADLWAGVETSLTNFLALTPLLERLLAARLMLPQRALAYNLALPDGERVTVRAVPDLLAFFRDAPPLIVDWKVSAHPAITHREQLVGYALALSKSRTQPGLPPFRAGAAATELLEAQLLAGELRPHPLTDADVREAEAHTVTSAAAMKRTLAGRPKGELDPRTVPPTADLGRCGGCPYKPLCWAGGAGPRPERD